MKLHTKKLHDRLGVRNVNALIDHDLLLPAGPLIVYTARPPSRWPKWAREIWKQRKT